MPVVAGYSGEYTDCNYSDGYILRLIINNGEMRSWILKIAIRTKSKPYFNPESV